MLLRLVFVVFLCVWSSQGWNVDLSGRYAGQLGQQPRPGVVNSPRCFGLARRTRQQKINVPFIYNSRTGQLLPFPKFLYNAERSVIARAEKDGWEVKVKNVYIPRSMYERVPICCPWEQNCEAGRQIITSPAAENPGACANGGQMIYRDGQQRCECAPGYQGVWCHLRVLPGEHQPIANFPSGPLIRMLPAPIPYGDMISKADIWRSKAKQSPGSPMPLSKGHLTAAVSPLAYGAAVAVQRQKWQARMAEMEDQYRKLLGDLNNQMSQQTLTPPDVRKNMMLLGRNPYNDGDSRADGKFLSVSDINKNPYSTISSQGQLPPNMMRAFYAVQEELKHKQNLNPYSHVSRDLPKSLSVGVLQRVNADQAGENNYNTHPPQVGLPQRVNADQAGENPYNTHPPQGENPYNTHPPQGENPYNTHPPQGENPYNTHPPQGENLYNTHPPQGENPYNTHPPQGENPYNTHPPQGENPYNTHPPQGENPYNTHPPQGRDMPQARTPWDLDPFGQQQNPSYMNYPGMPAPPNRNKQAMAILLYQQLMNQHKAKLSGRQDSAKRPTVNDVVVQTPVVVHPVNIGTQQQQLLGSPQEESAQPQQVTIVPETTSSNINEQQQIQVNEQPFAPMPGPNPLYQQQAGSEEMKRIEQCQAILTPRLSACLKGYGLVMEQFMNPEYMQKARAVCLASQSVGQCIMQHDQACGQGDAVMATRKMINSVLHMMGMICQQIAARGVAPIMPGQGQQNLVQVPSGGMPALVPEPLPPNDAVASDGTQSVVDKVQEPPIVQENLQQQGEAPIMPGQSQQNLVQVPGGGLQALVPEPLPPNDAAVSGGTLSVVEKVQEPPMVQENLQQQGEALPKGNSGKASRVNSVQDDKEFTEAPFSKGQTGHDSAHPVSQELRVLGYPLWLVITVGLALFVALTLSVVAICLCCRRRCRQKSAKADKEIEKMPAPLERVCSIGIPPPAYNTTILQQNEDGLDLPPLDLNDAGDSKVARDDEADDESDETDDKKSEEKRK